MCVCGGGGGGEKGGRRESDLFRAALRRLSVVFNFIKVVGLLITRLSFRLLACTLRPPQISYSSLPSLSHTQDKKIQSLGLLTNSRISEVDNLTN